MPDQVRHDELQEYYETVNNKCLEFEDTAFRTVGGYSGLGEIIMGLNKSQPKVLVIHGPNLNMLGKREPEMYGATTLKAINSALKELGKKLGLAVEFFQSNHEGAIVEKIQRAAQHQQGLIINPAAYTHTSIAIRDALLLLDIPVVEVHLSNIYKREPFRRQSMISDVVSAQITGFGVKGYTMALEAIAGMVQSKLHGKDI